MPRADSGNLLGTCQYSVKCQLSDYVFITRVLPHRNNAWTLNLDQKVGRRQDCRQLQSHGASKTMRLQWPFKRIIANVNYRQSVRIIGIPYSSNTSIIVTRRFSFIVYITQRYRNHSKITSRCMTTQGNYRQRFVSRDELVRGRRFFTVSRRDSGTALSLLCPCSEK